ncbi:MAG: imidazole glycerol phosphate synthase subunit HisH [Ruminococcus sp.]|jgi:glutamine amidotransferase|nr:imidazole glycerol phosphate synthase subunit HisH [Ruminococcus sp.]
MTAIIDYGAGNIFSVKNALDFIGEPCVLTEDPAVIEKADRVILPGVGAFPAAMEALNKKGLVPILKKTAAEKPFLGICLGMQILFDKGYEFAETEGLGLIGGTVEKIPESGFVIPHMGWNALRIINKNPLTKSLSENPYVYFVHSFAGITKNRENLAAVCDYGVEITALVWDGKFTFGAQFHPEKSGDIGMEILRNFCRI